MEFTEWVDWFADSFYSEVRGSEMTTWLTLPDDTQWLLVNLICKLHPESLKTPPMIILGGHNSQYESKTYQVKTTCTLALRHHANIHIYCTFVAVIVPVVTVEIARAPVAFIFRCNTLVWIDTKKVWYMCNEQNLTSVDPHSNLLLGNNSE